jgi:hypothetical protein
LLPRFIDEAVTHIGQQDSRQRNKKRQQKHRNKNRISRKTAEHKKQKGYQNKFGRYDRSAFNGLQFFYDKRARHSYAGIAQNNKAHPIAGQVDGLQF